MAVTCDGDEFGESKGDSSGIIEEFSYHFHGGDVQLQDWRIDFEGGDLHAHTETRHTEPHECPISITDFNLCLALVLAINYINRRTYPFRSGEEDAQNFYQPRLDTERRRLGNVI